MRILIFGATGMLGKALLRRWPTDGDEVTGLGSAQADIREPAQVEGAIRESKPDWIVLAAAYTDVDGCELNPTLANAVNTLGALNVGRAAAAASAKLLLVSTDYVFDGTKTTPYETNDPRSPISVYGRSKAEAEEKILSLLPDACIVRTSWLFGPGEVLPRYHPETRLEASRDRSRHCGKRSARMPDLYLRPRRRHRRPL